MSSRPRRIPPPLTSGVESLEGDPILCELSGDAALYVWKSYRTLRLWAESPAADRAKLYSAAARRRRLERLRDIEVDADLRPLLVRSTVVMAEEGAEPEEAAEVARQLAEWAEKQGAAGTALELMQCAALALPVSGSLARLTAILARKRAQYARAESWYRVAIARARLERDWRIHARSFLGLGTVHLLRGNHPAARAAFLRGLRSARRQGLRVETAQAYHDLLAWATRTDRPVDAARYAGLALQAYPPSHPRLMALGHDLALHWMKVGKFREALPVFQALPEDYGDPSDRVARSGSIARAAAAVGNRSSFEHAWAATLALLRHPAAEQSAASAYLYLAHGARTLGEGERARWAAEQACKIAGARGEAKAHAEAEALLDSLARGTKAKIVPPEQDVGVPSRGEDSGLAVNLVAAIAAVANRA
jgi:tetratricopeptide (TPR) repeat protein